MQLTLENSAIRKYSSVARSATGRNSSHASLILRSVSLAPASFSATSAAVALVTASTSISSVSSSRLPCAKAPAGVTTEPRPLIKLREGSKGKADKHKHCGYVASDADHLNRKAMPGIVRSTGDCVPL